MNKVISTQKTSQSHTNAKHQNSSYLGAKSTVSVSHLEQLLPHLHVTDSDAAADADLVVDDDGGN